jgi:hypothetical protein
MPLFITQGRFTQDAVKGMIAKLEDRAEAVGQIFAKSGGNFSPTTSRSANTTFLLPPRGRMRVLQPSHRRGGGRWGYRPKDVACNDFQ